MRISETGSGLECVQSGTLTLFDQGLFKRDRKS